MAGRIVSTTITSTNASDPRAQPTTCTLHVVHPPELRCTFALGAAEITLGRDPGIDGLLLDHGTVSRRHAALAWSPAHATHALRDLGSRNGSQADGVTAVETARPLVDGSLLRLGDTLLVYEQDGAPGVDAAAVARDAVPGEAASIRRLRALMARAATDPAAALVLGETGTGKERIARELHRLSGRPGKLVAVNCAALSPHIVESTLFGHLKGAFTGASEPHAGLFRAAEGGTLFLDEIGDLPLELQPKLLRVLQEGELYPLGSTKPVAVDVRVVAATHRDLAGASREGRFREDLYARLSLWELRVPALRERRRDILDWVDRLHAEWTAKRGASMALRFDADAAETILRFAWPLNLRGLERLVHELGARTGADAIVSRAMLPAWLGAPAAPGSTPVAGAPVPTPAPPDREPPPSREEFERAYEELAGNVSGLARRFARDRRQIYRWLEAYGLGARRS